MRYVFILLALLFFVHAPAQDKTVLKKQMMELLLAYPNKFRDIKNDGFAYEFKLTGTTGETSKQLRGDTLTASISIKLARGGTEEETNAVYNKWSDLIDNVDFNGARLTGKNKTGDSKFSSKSKIWKLDNSSANIDRKYLGFSVSLEVLKIGSTYHPFLVVGDE